MNNRKKQILSDMTLIFVAFLWGGGFVAVKDTLNSLGPMSLNFFRFLIAVVAMRLFLFTKIGKIEKKDIKGGLVVGLLLYLGYASQTIGLQYTTASKQGFVTATYVVMVPFLYWLIHRKRPLLREFVASFAAIIGVGLISLDQVSGFNLGDGLTLVCAFFFALHILTIEVFAKEMDVLKLTYMQMLVACILFLATALVSEPISFNLSSRAWGALLYLGVFSSFLCLTLQTTAQKYTSSSHVSIFLSAESLFAAGLGVMLLGETLSLRIIIGGAVIIAAILLVELKNAQICKGKPKDAQRSEP
ncbi:DMT family transporter [Clostridia bacterium]|nr:DMT family transporter [Clostridia bacterium]